MDHQINPVMGHWVTGHRTIGHLVTGHRIVGHQANQVTGH